MTTIILNIINIINMNDDLTFLRSYVNNSQISMIQEQTHPNKSLKDIMNDLSLFINDDQHTQIKATYLSKPSIYREIGIIFCGMFNIRLNMTSSILIDDDIDASNESLCDKYSVFSLMRFVMSLYKYYEKYIILNDDSNDLHRSVYNYYTNSNINVNDKLYYEYNIRLGQFHQKDFKDDTQPRTRTFRIITLDNIRGCVGQELKSRSSIMINTLLCQKSFSEFIYRLKQKDEKQTQVTTTTGLFRDLGRSSRSERLRQKYNLKQ